MRMWVVRIIQSGGCSGILGRSFADPILSYSKYTSKYP